MGSTQGQRGGKQEADTAPCRESHSRQHRRGEKSTVPQGGIGDTVLSFKSLRKTVMEQHFCAANGERAVSSSHSTENRFPWSHQLGNEDAVKPCALHSTVETG